MGLLRRSIKEWRIARGMSEKDLATAVGVTVHVVYLWEKNRLEMTERERAAVARAFSVNVGDIEPPDPGSTGD